MRTLFHDLFHRGIRSRFLKDAGLLASGVFVAQVIALAISPVLTRLFTPEDFGIFALIVAAAGIIATFATLRIESIVPAVVRDAEALRLLQAMLVLTTATSVALCALIFMFPSFLLRFIPLPSQATAVMWMLPLSVAGIGLYAGVRAWCVRKARFTAISTSQIVRALVAAVVWLGFGLASKAAIPSVVLAAGQASADISFSLNLFRSLKRRELWFLLRPRPAKIAAALRANRAMIATLVSSQSIAALYGRLPLIVIAAVFGIEKAGYYALVERIVGAPMALISNAIGDVYRQRAADAHRRNQPFHKLMTNILMVTLSLSVVPCVILMALTPHYIGFVLGEKWQPAAFTMILLLLGALVSFNTTAVDKAAIIKGTSGYILTWHSLRLCIEVLIAAAAFKGLIGYEGYIVAVVVGRILLYLWDVTVEYRLAKQVMGAA